MKKLLFCYFLLFWSPFLWAKDLTAKEALKIMNETQRAQLPHLLRQSQQEKFLKACGDQSFKSDENLFYQYCEAFISSDLCKDVEPEKRMNCNEDLKASVTHAPENVWNCMKGVGLGIKDIIVVLGKILEGIFTFITSPIESTKKGAKIASAGLGQLQNYVSTEHMRQLQIINKENPPPDSRNNKRRASAAVEEIILSNLIDNVFNFLGEKNTAFACYNDENKWKRSCQLITNIVSIVAGGAIAGKGIHSAAQWFMRPKPGTSLTPPSANVASKATKHPSGLSKEVREKILADPDFQKRIADIEASNGRGYKLTQQELATNMKVYYRQYKSTLDRTKLTPPSAIAAKNTNKPKTPTSKGETKTPVPEWASKSAIKKAEDFADKAKNNYSKARASLEKARNDLLEKSIKLNQLGGKTNSSKFAKAKRDYEKAHDLFKQAQNNAHLYSYEAQAARGEVVYLKNIVKVREKTDILNKNESDFANLRSTKYNLSEAKSTHTALIKRTNHSFKKANEAQERANKLTGKAREIAQQEANTLKTKTNYDQSLVDKAFKNVETLQEIKEQQIRDLFHKTKLSLNEIDTITYEVSTKATNKLLFPPAKTGRAAQIEKRKLSLNEAKNLNQQKPLGKLAVKEAEISYYQARELSAAARLNASRAHYAVEKAQKEADKLTKKAEETGSSIIAKKAEEAKEKVNFLKDIRQEKWTIEKEIEEKTIKAATKLRKARAAQP